MKSNPASPACKTSALTTFFILFYLIMYVGITTLSTDSEPVQKSKLISCPSPTIYVALYLYISIRHVKIRRHQHFRRIQHNIIIVMWIKLTALKVLNNLTKLQSNLKLSKRKPHRLFFRFEFKCWIFCRVDVFSMKRGKPQGWRYQNINLNFHDVMCWGKETSGWKISTLKFMYVRLGKDKIIELLLK